jgi:hypothetical protein
MIKSTSPIKQTGALAFAITLLFAATITAQKIEKPKLSPQPPTPAQSELINEGIALHDARRFDEAIKKYEMVLRENPDCTLALYELPVFLQ